MTNIRGPMEYSLQAVQFWLEWNQAIAFGPIYFQALSRQVHNPHVTAQIKIGEPLVAQST
jgi:hypothetical protein